MLTEGIGWEAIFFINVPLGLGVIVLTLQRVEETRNPRAGRIDWGGLISFSGALFLLIFALIRGNEEGWGSGLITGMLIGAAVLLVAFFVIGADEYIAPHNYLLLSPARHLRAKRSTDRGQPHRRDPRIHQLGQRRSCAAAARQTRAWNDQLSPGASSSPTRTSPSIGGATSRRSPSR